MTTHPPTLEDRAIWAVVHLDIDRLDIDLTTLKIHHTIVLLTADEQEARNCIVSTPYPDRDRLLFMKEVRA